MFNKKILILLVILVGLIISIICLIPNNEFKAPSFDHDAKSFKDVPNQNNVLKVNENYAFYIDGKPYVKDNHIYVNFYSLTSDNIFLKVRVFQDDNIIAESGLLKSNEWIEKLNLKKELSKTKKIKYMIMSYEKDTYYSMGEVQLNVQLEENK